jgi:3-oxoacyl-ACP reductase-like protein
MTVISAAEAPAAAAAAPAATATAISASAAASERLEEIGYFAAGFHEHVVERTRNVGVLLVDERGGAALQ